MNNEDIFFSFNRLEKQYAQEEEELKKKKADLWTVFYNLKKQRAETHSLWCHLHRTLTIADSVRREMGLIIKAPLCGRPVVISLAVRPSVHLSI